MFVLLRGAVASACLFAVAHQPAPAEAQQEVEAIDFDALRAQAASRVDLAATVARSARGVGRYHCVLTVLQPGRNATAPLVWSVSRSMDVW